MKQKYKYVFNKKTGHFVKKLNEDDTTNVVNNQQPQQTTTNTTNTTTQPQQNTTTNTTQQQNTNGTTVQQIKSIDSNPDIQTLNKQLSDLTQKYNNDMAIQQKTLDAAKIAASNKQPVSIYDPVMTDSNVLNTMKKMNDITRKYHLDIDNLEDRRIQLLQKMAQMKESYYKIPEKYKYLNESNIHTAKIYMKDLIAPDDNHILKGMADFKRVFRDTNLLYGKDREGYFIVALDSEDFNTATDALEEVGYLRDEILDTIMPQVLDRHMMIQ